MAPCKRQVKSETFGVEHFQRREKERESERERERERVRE